ncbi:thioredoxin-dependent thiol peroxidase [Acetobacteroides hydrogenigenes]|uniref:thioredoxin-dependent peroxiredoxin n=1 Tax=Acetobacteroides hydrogenigenes TaxID=979970 RepID=A0A4R2ETM5_9BACT|nr:thioredoxin-dependent thiol peroxidase [Acetobacteroides hydrogenigenes]TCN70124.1 peroxiredoxin Q/BCP [Acetobacteroides hydrogenigenes]
MATLQIGDKAPDFKGIDQNGKAVTLGDFAGKRLVLYFYPKDNTPGCTDEACSLRDGWSELRAKGFEVLGVSADSEASHQKFIEKHSLPFNLIADTEKVILEAYNAWGEKSMYGKKYMGVIRKTYVIDGNGIIENIFEKVKVKSHAEQILDAYKK